MIGHYRSRLFVCLSVCLSVDLSSVTRDAEDLRFNRILQNVPPVASRHCRVFLDYSLVCFSDSLFSFDYLGHS